MKKLYLISELNKISYAEYTYKEVLNKRLLGITPKEAKEEFGIKYRSTLKKIKDRIRFPNSYHLEN